MGISKNWEPVKCNCGSKVCQRYGFKNGTFPRGSGFDNPDDIVAISMIPEILEVLKEAENKLAACDDTGITYLTIKELNKKLSQEQDDKNIYNRFALAEALLRRAYEHLDYCGFGDEWERSLAIGNGLVGELEKYFKK